MMILFLLMMSCPQLDATGDGYVYFDDIIPNLELSMFNLLLNVDMINELEACFEAPVIEMLPDTVEEGDIFLIQIDMPVGNIDFTMLVSSYPFPIELIAIQEHCLVFEAVGPIGASISFIVVVYDIAWKKTWLLPVLIEGV